MDILAFASEVHQSRSTLNVSENDFDWYLKQTRVFEAWKLFRQRKKTPGEGVAIGVIDTGVSNHPELQNLHENALRLDLGWDFLENDPEASEDFVRAKSPIGWFLDNRGHGTSVVSMFISPKGAPDGSAAGITGITPFSSVIPFRIQRTPLLGSFERLEMAIDNGTTFAAPQVAAAAALWLSYHGKDVLLQFYGSRYLATVFQHLLHSDGYSRPDEWDSTLHGACVLNVERFLSAPLPHSHRFNVFCSFIVNNGLSVME